MIWRRGLNLLFLALCIGAVVQPLLAQHKQPAVADELARIRSEWSKDLHDKQLDRLVALYAPDAVFMKPSGRRVSGRPAIRDLCKSVMDTFTSDISMHSLATDHSGDLAYDSGEYSESLVKTSDGTKADIEGNYVMIPEGVISVQICSAISQLPSTE
jgi:ketosteroid isomerase-like protein